MGIFSRKKSNTETVKKSTSDQPVKSMKDLYNEDSQLVVTDDGSSKKSKKRSSTGLSYKILIKPVITEKTAKLASDAKYVFAVAKDANKISVANAIEDIYHVRPIKVTIINVKGKTVRRGRITGKRKDWKKAIVCLPAGKSLNIYEGV